MGDERMLKDISFLQASKRAELAMAEFYAMLGRRLKCSKKLWNELENEEKTHSYRFDRMMEAVISGDAVVDSRRHKTKAVIEFCQLVESKTKSWESSGVSRREAFEFAMKMESTLVESRMFIPTMSDSPSLMEMMWEIREDSNDHFQRVKRERDRKEIRVGMLRYLLANARHILGI